MNVDTITRRAIVGETLDVLGPGVTSRFDHVNALTIRLVGGALSSLDDARALSGVQTLAVGGPDGQWEVLSFANATLIDTGIWRISRLVRGLGGQDELSTRTLSAGAPVILLDEAVIPLVFDPAFIGDEQTYRFYDASGDYADELAVEVTAPVRDIAMKPYSPVHPRARRIPGGVAINFIRRGRVDADGWGLTEIPLGEDREEYRLEIMDGSVVKRAVNSTITQFLYTDEITDFGAPQTILRLRIAQVSATAGHGFARTHDVFIN